MTIAFGHGIADSPLQTAEAVAALVNGGYRYPASLLKVSPTHIPKGEQVLSHQTSRQVRRLMRLVVTGGTGKKANVPGYMVGGKTGTAEKEFNGRYKQKKLISSFVAAFPMDAPRYVILVLLDQPKGIKQTHYFATGGWVAAPVVGRIVKRMAPVVDILPIHEDKTLQPVAERWASAAKVSTFDGERRFASR